MLMSFIPAAVALLAIFVVRFYPLTTDRVDDIVERLKEQRRPVTDPAQAEEMIDYATN